MNEFNVSSFATKLFDYILDSRKFPYMNGTYPSNYGGIPQTSEQKHPRRNPSHLKEAIRQNSIKFNNGTKAGFEIGNYMLETNHPYYHILQNSAVIHKRNKGTKKSKGSQALIEDKGKRDYERVSWNGKTFTKEYSKNVRGSRLDLSRVQMHIDNEYLNRGAKVYLNMHYKYIDDILDTEVVDRLALEFGLSRKRKIDGGLGEEYEMTRMTDLFGSHDLI